MASHFCLIWLAHSLTKHFLGTDYVSHTAVNSGGYSMNKTFPGIYSLVEDTDKKK